MILHCKFIEYADGYYVGEVIYCVDSWSTWIYLYLCIGRYKGWLNEHWPIAESELAPVEARYSHVLEVGIHSCLGDRYV